MKKIFNNSKNIILILVFVFSFLSKTVFGNQAYFDLSEKEIEIQTNFNGKEVIIFGLTEPMFDTAITIIGPTEKVKLQKKERFFGLWVNSKKIIYRNLPSIFFIASSSNINKILNEETIIEKSLYFDQMLADLMNQRNFNFSESNKSETWKKNLIQIKKEEEFYKDYKLRIVDNKLFQTRVFFPSNTIPGTYKISIYQIQNKKIISEKNKKIIIKRTGIGNTIYNLAKNSPGTYGIICILFAIFAGLLAASAFRRL